MPSFDAERACFVCVVLDLHKEDRGGVGLGGGGGGGGPGGSTGGALPPSAVASAAAAAAAAAAASLERDTAVISRCKCARIDFTQAILQALEITGWGRAEGAS